MPQVVVYQDFVELIAGLSPEKIIGFRPSPTALARAEELLYLKNCGKLTRREEDELNYFMMLEKIFGLAKARAMQLAKAA